MVVERASMERVCVTAAGGFIGSCLVRNLLERGYFVHATSTDPENPAKTDHLLSLPGAKERLRLFKANLYEKGSFDSAIQGCDFVINLATSFDYTKDPETGFIQPAIDGTLDILRACKEAKTVRRVIHTSSITAALPLTENGVFKGKLDESCWTPIHYMRSKKPVYWMYYVAKTLAEQAALEYGAGQQLKVITVVPALVGGPSITPTFSTSSFITLAPITGNQQCYEVLRTFQSLMGSVPFVHVEDVCNSCIFLMNNPSAHGRYLCSSDNVSLADMAEIFRQRYPSIRVALDDKEQIEKLPISSQKLKELGFSYKYGMEEIVDDSVECAKHMQVL